MTTVAGVGHVNGHLAVGNLAQGATVLPCDADAFAAAFGKATFIEDEHTMIAAQFRLDPAAQFFPQRRIGPRGLADEDLHHADLGGVAVDLQGDGLGGLVVRVIQEEAAQVSVGALGTGIVAF